jgi:glutaminase
MINAGAIATASLVAGATREARQQHARGRGGGAIRRTCDANVIFP